MSFNSSTKNSWNSEFSIFPVFDFVFVLGAVFVPACVFSCHNYCLIKVNVLDVSAVFETTGGNNRWHKNLFKIFRKKINAQG